MATKNQRGGLAMLMTQVLTLHKTEYVAKQLGISQSHACSIKRGSALNPPKNEKARKSAGVIQRKLEEMRRLAHQNGVPPKWRRTKALSVLRPETTRRPHRKREPRTDMTANATILMNILKKLYDLGIDNKVVARNLGLHPASITGWRRGYNTGNSPRCANRLPGYIAAAETLLPGQPVDADPLHLAPVHVEETEQPKQNGRFSLLAKIIETSTGVETKMPLGSTLRFDANIIEISTDEQGICIITIGG